MRRPRSWLLLVVLGGFAPASGAAQASPLIRGFALEQEQRFSEAAVAFREALAAVDIAPAILGLERAYAALGRTDSLIPLIDSLVTARPTENVLRTVQLRALQMLGRHEQLRAAFDRWVRERPRDPSPYREYARLLLESGRAVAADSVLQRGQREMGSARDFYYELAQMRAQLGLWGPSAEAWRLAVGAQPQLEQAAIFALLPTPADMRPAVRQGLLIRPGTIAARRVLAGLELRWGSPSAAWMALASLPADSATAAAWSDFADDAEQSGEWNAAGDALAALFEWRRTPETGLRAARAALAAGEAAQALTFTRAAASLLPPERRIRDALPLEVEALSAVGRPDSAAQLLARAGAPLPDPVARRLKRAIAWGWVRAGDLERARAALAEAGAEEDADATAWLALYEGDLGAARALLRSGSRITPDAIAAMAVLTRTRADSAPGVGRAFLALARRDSVTAAREFAAAADALPDAAPLLLTMAARLHLARKDDARAAPLWERVAVAHTTAPEAAEADLEWARLLRRRGDAAAAIARLEHLILTHPNSALLPQARRELEQLRQRVPQTT